MKKTFLFLLLAFITQYIQAEEFNEINLLGSWELTSCEGSYPGFTTNFDFAPVTPAECKYLYLGPVDNTITLPGTKGSLQDGTILSGGLLYPENTDLTATAEWDYDDYDSLQEVAILLSDFMITNQNKLHIAQTWGGCDLRFIIENLTADEMKLKSYDGKCTVTYKRITDSSKVKGVNVSEDTEDEYYNLNGNRMNHPQKGVNIIRKKGESHKELK